MCTLVLSRRVRTLVPSIRAARVTEIPLDFLGKSRHVALSISSQPAIYDRHLPASRCVPCVAFHKKSETFRRMSLVWKECSILGPVEHQPEKFTCMAVLVSSAIGLRCVVIPNLMPAYVRACILCCSL